MKSTKIDPKFIGQANPRVGLIALASDFMIEKDFINVIKNRKIRVAIVGCGRISKNHFSSLEKHQDNIQLISICETNRTVLSDHEKKYNIKGYLDLSNMLEKEDLDMAIICTPSGMHAEQTELCAKHGVSVMTEKPMATRWSDGLRMVKACDDEGVQLFVVKQNRRNKTLQLLKKEGMTQFESLVLNLT